MVLPHTPSKKKRPYYIAPDGNGSIIGFSMLFRKQIDGRIVNARFAGLPRVTYIHTLKDEDGIVQGRSIKE